LASRFDRPAGDVPASGPPGLLAGPQTATFTRPEGDGMRSARSTPRPTVVVSGGAATASGGGSSSFFFLIALAGLAALAVPRAWHRLQCGPEAFRPAPFLLLLERPG
ncbi:MAG TPA: hypothetical protein VF880_14405, partial [Actinomycetes bacterium]